MFRVGIVRSRTKATEFFYTSLCAIEQGNQEIYRTIVRRKFTSVHKKPPLGRILSQITSQLTSLRGALVLSVYIHTGLSRGPCCSRFPTKLQSYIRELRPLSMEMQESRNSIIDSEHINIFNRFVLTQVMLICQRPVIGQHCAQARSVGKTDPYISDQYLILFSLDRS